MDGIEYHKGIYWYRGIMLAKYISGDITKIEGKKIIDAIISDNAVEFIFNYTFGKFKDYFFKLIQLNVDYNKSSEVGNLKTSKTGYGKSTIYTFTVDDLVIRINYPFNMYTNICFTLFDKTVNYGLNIELEDERIGNHLLPIMTKSAMK